MGRASAQLEQHDGRITKLEASTDALSVEVDAIKKGNDGKDLAQLSRKVDNINDAHDKDMAALRDQMNKMLARMNDDDARFKALEKSVQDVGRKVDGQELKIAGIDRDQNELKAAQEKLAAQTARDKAELAQQIADLETSIKNQAKHSASGMNDLAERVAAVEMSNSKLQADGARLNREQQQQADDLKKLMAEKLKARVDKLEGVVDSCQAACAQSEEGVRAVQRAESKTSSTVDDLAQRVGSVENHNKVRL